MFTKMLRPFVVLKLTWFYIYNQNVFWQVTVGCLYMRRFHIYFGRYHMYDPNLSRLGMAVNENLIDEFTESYTNVHNRFIGLR